MQIRFYQTILLSLFFCHTLQAKDVIIKLKVNNLPQTQVVLLQQKGDEQIPLDTVQASAGGIVSFKYKERYAPGMYSIEVHDVPVWAFIYSGEPVEAEIDLGAKPETARISVSEDNVKYYRFITAQNAILSQIDVVRSVIDQYPTGENFYSQAVAEFSKLQARQDSAFRAAMKGTKPSIAKTYISVSRQNIVPLSIPQPLRQEYAREHYFDYIPLHDTSLIYCNIYTSKLLKYYSLYTDAKQSKSDTQKAYITATDSILARVSAYPDMFRFTANFLMDGFEAIGQEAVADLVAQRYSEANSCTSADGLKGIDLKSFNRTKLRVGTDAPQFSLSDGVKKFEYQGTNDRVVLLVFWATWCPHCVETLPQLERKLREFANTKLDVVTVSLDTLQNAWRDFTVQNSMSGFNNFCPLSSWESTVTKQYAVYATPTFYVLYDGKIVAKPIDLKDVPNAIRSILKK